MALKRLVLPVLLLALLMALATTVLNTLHPISFSTPQIAEVRTAEQRFSSDVKRQCLAQSRGRDMITGELLRSNREFHHIRPVQFGGMGTLDNCIVVNLETHNALHDQMSNHDYDIQKIRKVTIARLGLESMRLVVQFLLSKGWTLDEYNRWISPRY